LDNLAHELQIYKSNTNLLEDSQMKKVLSTIVAALVALSFSAVVFAADVAPAAAPAADAKPAVEKKEAKPKKAKKAKKAPKKEVAPAAEAAPAAK
jgi:zona occludens toxin (predicted ATPase)